MSSPDLPAVLIGSVLALWGLGWIVFRRTVASKVPTMVSRDGKRIIQNTVRGVVVGGALILIIGLLTLLRGGLHVF